MGRQILEALVFLKERGFPVVAHLHSGNVVVQNGVARLAGLENTLLGFKSRIHPIVTSRLTKTSTVDVICFGKIKRFDRYNKAKNSPSSNVQISLLNSGHMLFEMCAGYELCTFKPTAAHLSDIETYPQVMRLTQTHSARSLFSSILFSSLWGIHPSMIFRSSNYFR